MPERIPLRERLSNLIWRLYLSAFTSWRQDRALDRHRRQQHDHR